MTRIFNGGHTPEQGVSAPESELQESEKKGSTERWLPFRFHTICFALLAICSFLAHELVAPRWNAHGFPSYVRYGKNVEDAASALTLIAVTLFVLMGKRLVARPGLAFWVMVAAALGLLGVYYVDWGSISILALVLMGSAGLFAWLDLREEPSAEWARAESTLSRAAGWSLLAVGSVWFLFGGLMPLPHVDLHHHGEIITSALDLLSGGVPYRTYFLPHGLSDTGLALMLIAITGSSGVGIIVLLNAVQSVLSFGTLFLFVWGLTRRVLPAVLITIAVGYILVLNAPWLCGNLFPVLAFVAISRRSDAKTLLLAGALLGLGYLWRIDAAMFGLAAVIVYLFCQAYYTQGYARDGRLWPHLLSVRRATGFVSDLGLTLLGMGLPLLISRLLFGFPTAEWFQTTLRDVPRYHRDSTGFPLPIAWKHYMGPNVPGEILLFGTPFVILLGLGLIAFLLLRVRERRLPLESPRDRFFLIAALYSLLNMKSIMDRSDPWHLLEGSSLMLVLLFCEMLYRTLATRQTTKERIALGCGALLFALCCIEFISSASLNAYSAFRLVQPWPLDLVGLRSSLERGASVRQQMDCSTDAQADMIAAGVAQVRALLNANGVGDRQLVVYHSASLLYPMLGQKLPTKYYQLGWAANSDMERDLVSELRRSHVRAFLQVNGIGRSLASYDVPDSYRLPVVSSYLLSRETRGRHYKTNLGWLTIVDESVPDAPTP